MELTPFRVIHLPKKCVVCKVCFIKYMNLKLSRSDKANIITSTQKH